jgi:uncharacterized protein (DUF305 family)
MGVWKPTTLIGACAVTVVVISAACTNSDSGRENSAGQTTSVTATAPATTPAADTHAHNNADVWFARHMIPYHQQAIEMSDIVSAKQGIDPRVTELANKIRAAMDPQIQQMQDWLSDWGNPPMPETAPGDVQMPAQTSMPGILSKRELDLLRAANGADASTLFLTQMIAHHEGSISVAQTETEEGQYPAAVAMARSIASTQQQEIDTMKRILSSM